MGDLGNAAAGGSSSGSSSLDQLFADASAAGSGTGDLFGGGGGGSSGIGDLSNLFADAGLGSALLGDSSGLGGTFTTDGGGASGADPAGAIGGAQSNAGTKPSQPQQPTQPPATQPTQSQDQSPLAKLASAVRASFGLGEKPTAGGPTGFVDAGKLALPGAAVETVAPGGAAAVAAPLAGAGFLLPFMTQPAETGELTPGQRGMNYRPEDDPRAPGRPQGIEDPTIAAGGPGAGAAQPPAAVAKPAPAAAPAPAATAAPAPASTDLPTRKPPATPEAAPGPSEGVYAPTAGGGGIGELLRDVLGLTLGNPTLLPLLAMALMGGRGRGRGGPPPWAFHGMMPFMRGTRQGFVGFRGGFLRPGYYPRRQGGWGFHPGGWHPGWGAWAPGVMGNQPMAFAGGGGSSGGGGASASWNVQSGGAAAAGADQAWSSSGLSSNPFLNTLVGQESGGGQNIVSRTDRDSRGLTLAQGGNPNEISQGYFQIQNHPGGTWTTYGRAAGIDLAKYPTPRSAPLEVQWQVASRIPISQWGHDTQVALQRAGFRYSPNMTLGQVAQANGGVNPTAVASNPSSTTIRQPGFRMSDPNADPLTSHAYPAPTETTAPAVQSDDFATAG